MKTMTEEKRIATVCWLYNILTQLNQFAEGTEVGSELEEAYRDLALGVLRLTALTTDADSSTLLRAFEQAAKEGNDD